VVRAGVWTVVDGDPVAMRRGDLLLTPGWHFHGHQNVSDQPMAWLDGLDIPMVATLDQGFFEFGPDQVRDTSTPDRSRGERLWGGPGLTPVSAAGKPRPASPLMAYRWARTDAALSAQLELEFEGHPGVTEPGHAAVRFTNPTTGGDALPTMRTEMHRLRAGMATAATRTTASSVWQVFDGRGTVTLDGDAHELGHGDVVAVPSWCELAVGTGHNHAGELLAHSDWRARAAAADGARHPAASLDLAPVIPHPGKVVCGRLGSRVRRRRRLHGPPGGREGRLRGDRRLLRAQRRHHARLAVPDDPVAAGQELRGDHACRPRPGHAG
jgi:gentisate 1,2-dioxygenase